MPVCKTPRNKSVGVIIVSYNTGDHLIDCINSLLEQNGGCPTIIVVDNCSTDDTISSFKAWCSSNGVALIDVDADLSEEQLADSVAEVILVSSGFNRGFAGGVNIGLKCLGGIGAVSHFWILNPDTRADKSAILQILKTAAEVPQYALMGGRVMYAYDPPTIQIDGGLINLWTGVSSNVNVGKDPLSAKMPTGSELDFITGASMVASREFYERVGPMNEDYFLYYEEVDWAFRRQEMALAVSPGLVVWHHAGTAIGSRTTKRSASAFSCWFMYRSRLRFIRRHRPIAVPFVIAYASVKAIQLVFRRETSQAKAILSAIFALPVPMEVGERLSGETKKFIGIS